VHPRRAVEPEGRGTREDVAAQEVERNDEEEAEHRQREQEPQGRLDGGKGEHVPADVAPEDRVGDAKRRGVGGLQHGVPGGGAREPAQQAESEGHREGETAHEDGDIHVWERLAHAAKGRMGHHAPLGRPQIQVENPRGDQSTPEEEPESRHQFIGEDDLVPHLLKPPPFGDQAGEGGQ